jgi:CRP-like cAMP-binding protein
VHAQFGVGRITSKLLQFSVAAAGLGVCRGCDVGNVTAATYAQSMNWRIFRELPASEVDVVLRATTRRTFEKGEVVFHRDDPGDSLHLVVSGRFAVRVMTPLGDSATLGIRKAGESFGEMALVHPEGQRAATVQALERGETRALAYSQFEQLRPAVDRVLVALLAESVRRTNELLLDALYVPAERRILRRLLELGDEVELTQEELAQLAGTSRATVNRVLREEEGRGTLGLARGRVTIRDRERIRRRART